MQSAAAGVACVLLVCVPHSLHLLQATAVGSILQWACSLLQGAAGAADVVGNTRLLPCMVGCASSSNYLHSHGMVRLVCAALTVQSAVAVALHGV